jgi:hypothetical protein
MRLGYDPFTVDAMRVVRVSIRSTVSSVEATVQMFDETGASLGRRDLEDSGSCAALVDVLVLAVSIAIDPASALGPVMQQEPATNEASPSESSANETAGASDESSADESRADREATERSALSPASNEPWTIAVGLSAFGQAGFSPSPTAGGALEARARRGLWSITLAGFGELPTGVDVSSGRVASYRTGASVIPCVHADFFVGCVVTQIGALVGHGETVPIAREETAVSLAFGVRARVEWTIERWLLLGAFVDVLLTPAPIELRIDRQAVWSTGIVAGVLGASVAFELNVSE